MKIEFSLQENGTVFVRGAKLDSLSWSCRPSKSDPGGRNVLAREAFERLQRETSLRHLVVGIIGPRDATDAQIGVAEHIGAELGRLGLTLICGGKSGVMTAVSKGCRGVGGLMIGILPGSQSDEANDFVDIPLPTGLGEARNMIIAKSARVLIAVGGSYGTLSEVAYGLHFSKTVVGVEGAPDVEGVIHADSADEAVQLALQALLLSAPMIENDANM